MTQEQRKELAAKLAPYVGRPCRIIQVFHDDEFDVDESNSLRWIDLHFFEGGEHDSIQVYAKPISQITEEDLIRVAEVATGLKGWQRFENHSGARLFLRINSITHHFVLEESLMAASWIDGKHRYFEYINPNYHDTLCQLGYAPDSAFQEGWAITPE